MKLMISAALLLAATISPAVAQDAPANANTSPPAADTLAQFTLDTPVEQIVADERAKAVLDANIPGVSTHESYDMFKSMSLRQLQPYSGGQITDEMLAKTEAEFAAIN
ncbi:MULTISPECIES: hypothetical protein [unclassified Sphingosinithalassobacter]|uniref:hypothetical protein n=1 Tax=unclassified Sphingosinithalassobacter TaxID=2676235 RepID=UPI00165D7A11|nr:hypothetical protein [Sphingosinithalassobacter sp. CS137]